MADMLPVKISTAAVFTSVATSIAVTIALVYIPPSELLWKIGSWTLIGTALLMFLAMPVMAYSLARNSRTRTWRRRLVFVAGLLYMAVLAYGALT